MYILVFVEIVEEVDTSVLLVACPKLFEYLRQPTVKRASSWELLTSSPVLNIPIVSALWHPDRSFDPNYTV